MYIYILDGVIDYKVSEYNFFIKIQTRTKSEFLDIFLLKYEYIYRYLYLLLKDNPLKSNFPFSCNSYRPVWKSDSSIFTKFFICFGNCWCWT